MTSTSAGRPTASELLSTEGALLSRGHLRDLGLPRRAIDTVFRELDVICLPGYSRPMIFAADYRRYMEQHTYRDGDRVRHASFGDGTVVTSRLTRDDEEVTVAFPDRGVKKLLASFANLELIG